MKTLGSCKLEVLVHLIDVQMHGENAPSQLILYHYADLKDQKGVVLMTAELDPKNIVSPLPSCTPTAQLLFITLHVI